MGEEFRIVQNLQFSESTVALLLRKMGKLLDGFDIRSKPELLKVINLQTVIKIHYRGKP